MDVLLAQEVAVKESWLNMKKKLIIVFVKNSLKGKVKTRLAKVIGDEKALKVYDHLLGITESAIAPLKMEKWIYYSDFCVDDQFESTKKYLQKGTDLGQRMKHAFEEGFEQDFEQIVLIGSDLPDISAEILQKSFKALNTNDCVFGKAEDGGYYLIGLSKINSSIFENKPWSQSELLNVTLQELKEQKAQVALLESLNDIDTYEDLIESALYKNDKNLQRLIAK